MAKILIAGDYCPQDRVAKMVAKSDYSFFDEIKEVVKEVDYSIVNFECPVVEGEAKPINKCGPALRTERRAVDSIKYAGFDCVTLANNHFRDFGDAGCKTTIEELDKQGVDRVGGGMTLADAQQILYKELGGQKIAVVNFCENEFSIATADRAGAAPMDTVDNYHQITEARQNADYVLVIVHGGHEHYQLPSPRMKKLYRYYIELGADAVVNHHQHCYSGYEYYNGKPIVYGLGNFCFDEGVNCNPIWYEGYMVKIDIEESKISLIPYVQCREGVSVVPMKDKDMIKFNDRISELNEVVSDDIKLRTSFDVMADGRLMQTKTLFASYHNRYLNAAANRGYIPYIVKKKEVSAQLNRVLCEAHRDVIVRNLEEIMNE